jgi:hypothetical protein
MGHWCQSCFLDGTLVSVLLSWWDREAEDRNMEAEDRWEVATSRLLSAESCF